MLMGFVAEDIVKAHPWFQVFHHIRCYSYQYMALIIHQGSRASSRFIQHAATRRHRKITCGYFVVRMICVPFSENGFLLFTKSNGIAFSNVELWQVVSVKTLMACSFVALTTCIHVPLGMLTTFLQNECS